jgi:hypothetical protein
MAVRISASFTASGQLQSTTTPIQGGALLEVGGSAVTAGGGEVPISTGGFDVFWRSQNEADWKKLGSFTWPKVVEIPATYTPMHVAVRSTSFANGSGSAAKVVLTDLAAA